MIPYEQFVLHSSRSVSIAAVFHLILIFQAFGPYGQVLDVRIFVSLDPHRDVKSVLEIGMTDSCLVYRYARP